MVFVTLTNGPLAGPPEVEPNKPPLKRPPLLELVEPNLSIQEPSSLNPAHPPPKSGSASPELRAVIQRPIQTVSPQWSCLLSHLLESHLNRTIFVGYPRSITAKLVVSISICTGPTPPNPDEDLGHQTS